MSDLEGMDAGRSVWRAVADRLAGEISAGVFKPGERLANERMLAERYEVHRHTLRRAVADLAERGLLDVRHGRGTFVRAAPIPYRVGAQTRFRRNIAALSRDPGGRLLASVTLPAPAHVAGALAIAPGIDVVRLDILREVDGVPLIRSEHWFPAAIVPKIAAHFEESQSISRALEVLGVRGLRRRDSTISTRPSTRTEAAELRLTPGSPLLIWESLKVDVNGTPLDFGVALLVGERVQLVLDLDKAS
ncbi:phosphonate metabolism transcriptional regulator PhnF [Roseomonas elaeocarpi]|uniref:Phosphonate metabolism transcriptional regulator PhnF n=1 Tax=Roseomonas elaeocarpi TaxID=907779 RepID=A0ABV6JNV0_9PROT